MRKTLVSLLLLLSGQVLLGQQSLNFQYTKSYQCQQDAGCDSITFDFAQDLYLRYDESSLQWTKSIFDQWQNAEVRKQTDQYIVARANELYLFVDLSRQAFLQIDFHRNTYRTWGYGVAPKKVETSVRQMITLLETDHTQKDVVQHLIDQMD